MDDHLLLGVILTLTGVYNTRGLPLIKKGTDVNETCDDSSPLHEASHECDSNVVSWLIQHGANLNLDLGDGYRPVIAAIRSDNAETLKTLIDTGAV
jgi:ankyrin repeat protein